MRVFELQKEDIMGNWRTLRNEKLYNSNSSSSFTRAIKSNRINSTGHVERIEGVRNIYEILN
jgi:hypothetical protein